MKVLVVGADYLGPLKENLQDLGIKQVIHWKGRNHEEVRKKIPDGIEAVILLCDVVNHNIVRRVKSEARRRGFLVIHARKSQAYFKTLDTLLTA
jgi:hypothetical protein